MAIIAEKLTHIYQANSPFEAKALQDVDMTIGDGEFIGIIGHTGSGKSTLIQHFNGLLKPSDGTLIVMGMDLNKKYDRKKLRTEVGLVFQYPEYQLFEETIQKDIAFGPKNMGLPQEEIQSRVKEAMEHVDLDFAKYAEKSPFELSGGQKRRAAIAGVIAMRPRILILDEPTAGLDPAGRHQILKLITRLRENTGCTIIMVSHNMDELSRIADRIYVMNQGGIAAEGTPAEVFMHEKELTAIGLDVPQITRLASKLRSRGLDVPREIFTTEALFDWLRTALKRTGQ